MALNYRKLINNIGYAFLAQIISLLLSFFTSFIVPKMLGIEEYSYWQLFIFYSDYAGFFQFGLSDGLYLRIGGEKYETLDHSNIGTQLRIAMVFQILIATIMYMYCSFTISDNNRLFIFLILGIYIVVFNTYGLVGYLFQAVNETKIYSISTIIDRLCYIAFIFFCIFFGIKNSKSFIILYLVSKVISCSFVCWKGRHVVFSKLCELKKAMSEMFNNIKVGINLMISNIIGNLILGVGRILIDNVWGIITFGKISFSLTLSNYVLSFISQISMVLFPTLRRVDDSELSRIYIKIRNFLSIVLPGVLLGYVPMKIVVRMWLPEYEESIVYLALLMPICTYSVKTNLLCNTYFKVLRKEKLLLRINVITLLITFFLEFMSSYVLKSLNVVIISMVIAIIFRNVVSEIYLSSMVNSSIIKDIISESIIVIIFMYSSYNFNSMHSFAIVLTSYIFFLIINKEKVRDVVHYSYKIFNYNHKKEN